MKWPWDSFFSQKATSVVPSQHHSIDAQYSYLIYHLPPTPNDDTASSKSGADNPQQARSYYAARGHICRLCICYQNYTVISAVRYTSQLFFHVRPANQPSIMGVVLCHNIESPWSKWYMSIPTGQSLIAWFKQGVKADIMEPCICLSYAKGQRGKII